MSKKTLVIILSLCIILPLTAFLNPSGVTRNMKPAQVFFICTHDGSFPSGTSVDGYVYLDPSDYGGFLCCANSFTSHYSYMVTADVGWCGHWYVGSGTDHYQYAISPTNYFGDDVTMCNMAEPECGHGVF